MTPTRNSRLVTTTRSWFQSSKYRTSTLQLTVPVLPSVLQDIVRFDCDEHKSSSKQENNFNSRTQQQDELHFVCWEEETPEFEKVKKEKSYVDANYETDANNRF